MLSDAPAVLARGLRKTYNGVEAVRGIDLHIGRGEIFAFLGPNGAGKTTAVEILEGFRQRTEGEVSVLGIDPEHGTRAWRDRLGIVLQESAPDPGLTVKESLGLYAGYYAQPMDADAVLALVGLEAQGAVIATKLSGGQRRRLDFGLALIGDPDLIFLDEPTTGFDPAARRAAWDVITGLRSLGKTILLTTHYMEEAEVLADRIAVIVSGRIVAEGRPGTLGGRDRAATRIAFQIPATASELVGAALQGSLETRADGRVSVSTTEPLAALERLAHWSRTTGTPITDLEVTRPSLEDIYLALTGSIQAEDT
ncbi:MAG: ABC transporter ATP-binding protein [Solirubrobacteraceae bacterium]